MGSTVQKRSNRGHRCPVRPKNHGAGHGRAAGQSHSDGPPDGPQVRLGACGDSEGGRVRDPRRRLLEAAHQCAVSAEVADIGQLIRNGAVLQIGSPPQSCSEAQEPGRKGTPDESRGPSAGVYPSWCTNDASRVTELVSFGVGESASAHHCAHAEPGARVRMGLPRSLMQ